MKAVWLLSLAVVWHATSASAENVDGMYAGAGSWLQNYHGKIASGIAQVDVEDDLAIGDEQNNLFYLTIEHAVRGLPNVRFAYARFEAQDQSLLDRAVDFNGVIFPDGTDIETLVDRSHTDAVFYYEVFDHVMALDLGFAARYVDGDMQISSVGESSRAEFSAWIPLGYAKARFALPVPGLWIGATALGLGGYNNESMTDANAQIGWRSRHGVGVELGYRWYRADLGRYGELDSAETDVSGPFAALSLRF